MFKRVRRSKYRWLILAYLLSGCGGGHPEPTKPTGNQIPVNADLWDYHGDEIFPVREAAP
jgi:hypothetical protein